MNLISYVCPLQLNWWSTKRWFILLLIACWVLGVRSASRTSMRAEVSTGSEASGMGSRESQAAFCGVPHGGMGSPLLFARLISLLSVSVLKDKDSCWLLRGLRERPAPCTSWCRPDSSYTMCPWLSLLGSRKPAPLTGCPVCI